MQSHEYLSVGDFSRLARTAPSALRHYEKIGLLLPEFRRINGYRQYSVRQLALCNTIRLLHKLGVPLAEINSIKDKRTPELALKLLMRQVKILNQNKKTLDKAKKLLYTLLKMIHSGLDADQDAIVIQYLSVEHIIIGEQNNYTDGRTDCDALYDFYNAMSSKYSPSGYDMQYPVWAIYAQESIKNGDWQYPDRYYFYNPDGQDSRPAGLYAIGHTHAGYRQNATLCRRMTEYIDASGYEICGDAYEEYPLNEICTSDEKSYLLRVIIAVREKQHKAS